MDSQQTSNDRREFVKKAGVGTLALASIPFLATAAEADDRTGGLSYRWMSVSRNPGETEQIVMNGDGRVNRRQVTGGGNFVHVELGGPPPLPLLGTGTWRARKLVSLDIIGTFGTFAAGVLVMDIHLLPVDGGRIPAQVTMNCNIPPAGLFTGLAEGYFLEVGDQTFSPWILPVEGGGPPPTIAVGATIFNIVGGHHQADG